MYANFPGREGMHKCECMLSGGDLDAVWTTVAAYREETIIYHGMLVSFPISTPIMHHGEVVSQFWP